MDNRCASEEKEMSNGDLIAELLIITAELGSRMERYETLNSVGRSSKKIVIEYNIEVKEK